MDDQRAAAESIQHRAAAERFAEQLRTLRAAVGNPSFRKMAGKSGRISHTTLHEAAAGTRFPSWETTREFVRACEADEAQWRRRWEDAQPAGMARAEGAVAADRAVLGESVALHGVAETPDLDRLPGAPRTAETAGLDRLPGAPGAAETAGLDQLPSAPRAAGAGAASRQRRRPRWLAAAAVLAVAAAAAVGIAIRDRSRDDSGAAAASPTVSPTAAPSSSDALIAGDASRFVADVTIPDGTRVKVNSQFVKVWAIANVGAVGWHHRFLARTDPAGDDQGCRTPRRVPIGDTLPGEQAMISVPVTAPSRPGRCWVSWKMVDEQGQPFFPSRRPVYFLVNVIS